jgi:signal transduction histidine kinase/ligand-binding sensor domain-containing protein
MNFSGLWIALGRCFFCVLACATITVHALDPKKEMTQYAHTSWRVSEGLLPGAPTSIAETKDGYLWVGTPSDLLRFDGIRFVSLNTISPGVQLPFPVTALYGSRDGDLWIGTVNGLLRWHENVLTPPKLPGRIDAIVETGDGVIWIARARIHDGKGSVCSVEHDLPHCLGSKDGNPFEVAVALASTPHNGIWSGIGNRIAKVDSPAWEVKILPSPFPDEVSDGVYAIAPSQDGSLWVGSITGGPGGGLQHLVQGTWKPVKLPGIRASNLDVTSLIEDLDGSLWIGTLHDGLLRLHEGKLDRFGMADGFTAVQVNTLFEDAQGNIWSGTSRGLDRFRDLPVTTLSTREGLASDETAAVLGTRDGRILVSGRNLSVIDSSGSISSAPPQTGLPTGRIAGLFEDHTGAYWFGCRDALYVQRGKKIKRIARRDGSNTGMVRDIAEESNGDIWISTTRLPTGIVRVHHDIVTDDVVVMKGSTYTPLISDAQGRIYVGVPGGGIQEYREGRLEKAYGTQLRERLGSVQSFSIGSKETLWAATSSGIELLRDGQLRKLTTSSGLPCERIFSLTESATTDLWVSSECGIFRLTRPSLERWWHDGSAVRPFPWWRNTDGAQPEMSPFSPRSSRSTDGRIWFANESVLQYVDPGRELSSRALPVQLEDVLADGKSYPMQRRVYLPPLTHSIEIQYTALDLANPQGVIFRYLLDGSDKHWQNVGTRRQAFFENLPPGQYTFRVQASNGSDTWFEASTPLLLAVQPALYQRTGFRLLLTALTGLALWQLNRLRTHHALEQLTTSLNTRHTERINIARDLHDTLLQGIQGLTLHLNSILLRTMDASAMRREIEAALSRADALVGEGRERVRGLRSVNLSECSPLDLSLIVSESPLNASVEVETLVTGEPLPVSPVVKAEVADILREALTNALRHADATCISLSAQYNKHDLQVSVRDDGRGIDPAILKVGRHDHWGIHGMRERAKRIGGELHIESEPLKGTSIRLRVPARIAYLRKSLPWKFPFRPLQQRETE